MRADRFLRLAKEALPELVRRYHLAEWWLEVEVVPAEELSAPSHVAEVVLEEPYRWARIRVSREALRHMGEAKALAVLEHEVQHVTGWWLKELQDLVMAALEDAEEPTRRVVERAFVRAHELYRGTLGRLLRAGNNWEVD